MNALRRQILGGIAPGFGIAGPFAALLLGTERFAGLADGGSTCAVAAKEPSVKAAAVGQRDDGRDSMMDTFHRIRDRSIAWKQCAWSRLGRAEEESAAERARKVLRWRRNRRGICGTRQMP